MANQLRPRRLEPEPATTTSGSVFFCSPFVMTASITPSVVRVCPEYADNRVLEGLSDLFGNKRLKVFSKISNTQAPVSISIANGISSAKTSTMMSGLTSGDLI